MKEIRLGVVDENSFLDGGWQADKGYFWYGGNGCEYIAWKGSHQVFIYPTWEYPDPPSGIINHQSRIETDKEFFDAVYHGQQFKATYEILDRDRKEVAKIEIKPWATYSNGSKTHPIHRLVTKIYDGRVYFKVTKSHFVSGLNAEEETGSCEMKRFQKWAKEIVEG